jgi:hypothetical protein
MIYALGPFRLDTHDAVLFRGTEPVALGRPPTRSNAPS